MLYEIICLDQTLWNLPDSGASWSSRGRKGGQLPRISVYYYDNKPLALPGGKGSKFNLPPSGHVAPSSNSATLISVANWLVVAVARSALMSGHPCYWHVVSPLLMYQLCKFWGSQWQRLATVNCSNCFIWIIQCFFYGGCFLVVINMWYKDIHIPYIHPHAFSPDSFLWKFQSFSSQANPVAHDPVYTLISGYFSMKSSHWEDFSLLLSF